MTRGRRSKQYVEGPRKQMTTAWKQRVLDRLKENKAAKKKPANLSQLATTLPADKRGIYTTFNLDLDPPQMSSAYVDQICELLEIGPPMLEPSEDEQLERDLDVIRALDPEHRKSLIAVALGMTRKQS